MPRGRGRASGYAGYNPSDLPRTTGGCFSPGTGSSAFPVNFGIAPDSQQNEATESPRKRMRFSGAAITVLVGPEKTSFVAYKELICENSPFFEKALDGDFKEADKNQVELPEIDPKSFDNFLQWLYTKSFDQDMLSDESRPNLASFSWSSVLKLYMLGNYLQCIAFGNDVIECVRRRLMSKTHAGLLDLTYVAEVYLKTPPGCALRRLIVLVHMTNMSNNSSRCTPGASRNWIVGFPRDFVEDVAARMIQDSTPQPATFWLSEEVTKELKDA